MTVKVTLITTTGHNIGDDYVRLGITHLLGSQFKDLSMRLIHKHAPVTAFRGFESIRSGRLSNLLYDKLLGFAYSRNAIGDCDVLVQSGAPTYWCHQGLTHCADNEWFEPLIRQTFLPRRGSRRFLNLAAGSCQHFHAAADEGLCARCASYAREFHDACTLTTVRDQLAQRLLAGAGRDAELLPCTSIFARDQLGVAPAAAEYIVLNVMDNAGHYRFAQDIDGGRWKQDFRRLARAAAERGKVVIACHSREEHVLARDLAPDLAILDLTDDPHGSAILYSRARFGIVNRVHAAFMLASLGKPAAVIGTDSRARMVDQIGLKSYFAGDLGADDFQAMLDDLGAIEHRYREQAESIRTTASIRYRELIAGALAA